MKKTEEMLCPSCGHHWLLHQGGSCVVKIMQSGYENFAALPECGCKEVPPTVTR